MTCKWLEYCPLRGFEKQGLIDNRWRNHYCESETNWKNCKRYQMTEKKEPHPDNMMPDGTIDEKIK